MSAGRDWRLTTRGWVVLYCVLAVAAIGLLIWADAAWFDPSLDHARIDAEQLQ